MDPISDMLTRIRNAYSSRQASTTVPYSKLKLELAKILKTQGFIGEFEASKDKRIIMITLKYDRGLPAAENLRRISRPGLRIYRRASDFKRVRGGLGISIVSTSRGLMTGENARKNRLGGEVLAEVY